MTTITLTTGETITPTLYGKCSDGERYSVFTADGGHRYVPVAEVASIDTVREPRPMALYDLPIFGRMWADDGRELGA
jgi:hypothetical protein